MAKLVKPNTTKKNSVSTASSRLRSPNYPAIGLRKAVESVRQLIDKDGKAGAPIESAMKVMGCNKMHSYARSLMSALRKFDLIVVENGKIKPTDKAISIVRFPAETPRHIQALRECALAPQIYRDLLKAYVPSGELPSDDSLRPEIVTDWEFNPKAVTDFLNGFRDSLSYAGLLEGNRLNPILEDIGFGDNSYPVVENEEVMSDDEIARSNQKTSLVQHLSRSAVDRMVFQDKATMTSTRVNQTNAHGSTLADAGPSIRFDLSQGNAVEIRMKSKVTRAEFEKVKRIFELSEIAFVEEITMAATVSMIMGRNLDQQQEKKLAEIDGALSAAFSHIGRTVRVCEGYDTATGRMVGFIEGLLGPYVSGVTAEEFDLMPREVLIQKIIANSK